MGKGSCQKEDEDIGGSADSAPYEFKMMERMGLRGQEGVILG